MCYPQPSLIQRDIVGLQNLQFNFDIKYRPGKVNKDADTLSRIPLDITQYMPAFTQATSKEVFSATLSDIMALRNAEALWIKTIKGANETLNLVSDIIDPRNYHKIEPHVILASQKRDPSIGRVLECKVGGGKPAVRAGLEGKFLTQEDCLNGQSWGWRDGVLRRCGENLQLVLPKQFYPPIFEELQQEMGHLGAERVL